MRIAILGAGFAGLSLAWHLCQRKGVSVDIFDEKGIGGEASGIATGLLHPYPGEKARRSWKASEGMEEAKKLFSVAENALGESVQEKVGILRHIAKAEESTFTQNEKEYKDVSFLGNGWYVLESGLTVYTQLYLEGLSKALSSYGVKLHLANIHDLRDLETYDAILVAAGSFSLSFVEEPFRERHFQKIKGQVLTCQLPEGETLERSLLGKGYVATMKEKGFCQVGATYERTFTSLDTDIKKAKELLYPGISQFYPKVEHLTVVGCKAAVRVCRRGHYFPFVKKIQPKTWVVTALGSRGLLYHAYLGKIVSEAVVEDREDSLPAELGIEK